MIRSVNSSNKNYSSNTKGPSLAARSCFCAAQSSHIAVANILVSSYANVQGELVRLHGLVGLNQLLLTGSMKGRIGAIRVVGVLAPSPDFQKNAARQGVVVNVAQMLADRDEEIRVAAAGEGCF